MPKKDSEPTPSSDEKKTVDNPQQNSGTSENSRKPSHGEPKKQSSPEEPPEGPVTTAIEIVSIGRGVPEHSDPSGVSGILPTEDRPGRYIPGLTPAAGRPQGPATPTAPTAPAVPGTRPLPPQAPTSVPASSQRSQVPPTSPLAPPRVQPKQESPAAPLPPTAQPPIVEADQQPPTPSTEDGPALAFPPHGEIPKTTAVSAVDGSPSTGEATSGDKDSANASEPVPMTRQQRRLAERKLQEAQLRQVETSDEGLTADLVIRPEKAIPRSGFRKFLYNISFGAINLGLSPAELAEQQTKDRINASLGGNVKYVAILSRKGGVGKTTVTTGLGMTLATYRDDRVIAIDANPDRGTLSERLPQQAAGTVRDVVTHAKELGNFNRFSRYVARDKTRLDVLPADREPSVSEAFSQEDYNIVTEVVSELYSIVLTDSGTGMVHSVMKGTIEKADAIVLVSGNKLDESRLASETLQWLSSRGREDLVRNAVVVLNASTPHSKAVNVEEIKKFFESKVRSVVEVPFDPHLSAGAHIDLDTLRPETKEAFVELAALVVDGLNQR